MSASLVGSEMCIRDRYQNASVPGRFCERTCIAEFSSQFARLRFRLLAHPVSYTHLTLPTICSV
eukprot:13240977-Alexandrium_andersonii.AAC.1